MYHLHHLHHHHLHHPHQMQAKFQEVLESHPQSPAKAKRPPGQSQPTTTEDDEDDDDDDDDDACRAGPGRQYGAQVEHWSRRAAASAELSAGPQSTQHRIQRVHQSERVHADHAAAAKGLALPHLRLHDMSTPHG
jgi:hypothetical protein